MTQIILSGVVAFLVAILLTPMLIRKFSTEGIGQEIREEGPQSHQRKRGTPTMGGIAILVGIVIAYIAANLVALVQGRQAFTATGLIVLGLTVVTGLLGFADDFIKLYLNRNLGLNKTAKLVGQFAAAILFGVLIVLFPDDNGITPGSTKLSFLRDIEVLDIAFGQTGFVAALGFIVFLFFIYILVAAWSNAVNLTDGLDGLAAGSTAMAMGAYTIITFWQFRNSCVEASVPACYTVRDPLDLAILAAAGLGACLGFLWWNAAPAKIFMGDTGSLGLGGLVAGLSVASRTELLMVVIGALFVVEAASVVIQVASYQTTGKRVFRMAPFHHHFEQGGWKETTVVVRFWLLSAMACIAGLAVFYNDWLQSAAM